MRFARPRRPQLSRSALLVITLSLGLLVSVGSGTSLARSRGRAAAGACPGADRTAASAPTSAMRAAVLCLVNAERTSRRLPALRENARLDRSAQGWSNTMVRTASFSHGADFAARISAVGYRWSDVGENIASGFETPRQVMQGWMASPGHCQNILSPGYENIGIGVNAHPLGRYLGGTWTQDFGLWMGHRSPSQNDGPARGCPYGA